MHGLQLKRKFIGICGIVLGVFCIGILFIFDRDEFILSISTNFIVKYFLLILFINSGIYFIVFGILNYIGILIPYYSEDITEYEKAKNIITGFVLSFPFWVCIFYILVFLSKSIKWKIVGSLAFIYIIFIMCKSIRLLWPKKR